MSRPPRTLQRLERILTLVPWLLDNPGTTLTAISERFDVDRDELAADLDILGYCGLPGYGGGDLVEVRIVGDRVSVHMADFFSRPVTLSVREAVTLLLAARAMASVPSLAESDALRRATAKLESALGGEAARVAVDLRSDGDQWLAPAREAVAEGRLVHLTYRSASKANVTERDVEPWAVVGHGGAWYLQGYCRQADGPRDFRLDRVRDLTVTSEHVPSRPEGDPAPPVYRPGPDDIAVTLDVARPAWWVTEWAVVDSVENRGARKRVVLRTPSVEWAARLVLQLGGHGRVVAPDHVQERVRDLVDATLAAYGRAGG